MNLKNILRILLDNRIIGDRQAKEIQFKGDPKRTRLEAQQRQHLKKRYGTDNIVASPVTILDVFTNREMHRANDCFQGMDEELLYQTLASAWGFPFKRIDPLKLDLNLVTTTIPHSFARKHVIIPLARASGTLTVAVTNPFDEEVLQDISRATQLKVEPVIATKTEIIKTTPTIRSQPLPGCSISVSRRF
jgi:general secretion pathway protein E